MIHVLRDDPAFVKELDFVMELDGALIGQNMFMRTVINATVLICPKSGCGELLPA